VDGKCLRGARRPDGSRVFVLSAVRHGDAMRRGPQSSGCGPLLMTRIHIANQTLIDWATDSEAAAATRMDSADAAGTRPAALPAAGNHRERPSRHRAHRGHRCPGADRCGGSCASRRQR
jgi:hypothetical protein